MSLERPIDSELLRGNERELNPNIAQNAAANPASSVWVSASAGTGKTKVLTDRVLRLLLPQEDGRAGCAPHKILGLTFTKAAASEMALRIHETLSEWAISDEGDLIKKLQALLARKPSGSDVEAARKLFADVIDTPGRLKIMTIHAFCQSVLSRFPLEAKLRPGFEVVEERAADKCLSDAKRRVFKAANAEGGSPLSDALYNLSSQVTEDQLNQLITAMASERGQMQDILAQHFGIDGYYTALCAEMGVAADQSANDILRAALEDGAFDRAGLKECADGMAQGSAAETARGDALYAMLAARDINERISCFDAYKASFLTAKFSIRKTLITKKAMGGNEVLLDVMHEEAERLERVCDQMQAAETASLARDLLTIGQAVLKNYAEIKARQNMLDYEDLIIQTHGLLEKRGGWVHYKLDEGIDHILIDEAQDTNPEQWKIIEALCEEFFPSHSLPDADKHRSIFIVGDEKQSIYSFQRASPEEFDRMRNLFRDKIQVAQQNWREVDLNISFRSTQSVLAAVDCVFSKPETRKGLGIGEIEHSAFRQGQAGLVEVWPLFENDTKDDASIVWEPPIYIEEHKSGSTKCAEEIAQTIAGWIRDKEILSSYNRPIEPRDIMVLVRTRNAFVAQLIRALKSEGVAVSGLDRMVLNNELAVQDMLAAADFALLAQDDLMLACLLKSPLIGLDEDALFALAYGREGSLWDSVQNSDYRDISDYLKALIGSAARLTPYAFFAQILQSSCPADDVSGFRAFHKRLGEDAQDSLHELLSAAINFEYEHTPSLQGFIQWQRSAAGDIKRESDDQSNQVRIMTVHGSKGLQAPIVFLPDTVSTPSLSGTKAANRLLWPTQTGEALPIWSPRKELECAYYGEAKDKVLERLDEEYRRLLYVAMTRAEDRLYVTGHKGAKAVSEKSWYSLCRDALRGHDDALDLGEGVYRLENAQSEKADRKPKPQEIERGVEPIPQWMYVPARAEPQPPAPLIPSRPSGDEPASLSPLNASDEYRFRRGNVTHTLLQFLPDLPVAARGAAMEEYLVRHADDLPDSVRFSISDEILRILEDDSFAALFSQEARAEVPITGLLADGRLVSGQIDRLLITDDEILIVDFKTNRPPPQSADDVPAVYYNQLKSYADVLAGIYPKRAIRCALLWTDGPRLMPIEIKS